MPSNTDKTTFIPGQRWLSEAEADLGLGTVTEVDFRLVKVAFPACGEERTYAIDNAPLARVLLTEGDPIEDRDGNRATVVDAHDLNGLLLYLVIDDNGAERQITESDLSDQMQLNRPQDRLLASRIDQKSWFSLRYESWLKRAEELTSPVYGLAGARVALIPHQLHIAADVAGRYAPRVLLADEVGLGKTIEAGMILHRMLLTGRAKRALIVVPEALLHQWLVEMLRRFNLRFSLFDEERFLAQENDDNPFLTEQRVLCSLEFLISQPKIARAALDGEWDLLVVDEAHHLSWDENQSSLEYDLIEALAEQTKGVLLLTATPEQLGRAGHFGRLRLLDPARFHDYRAFLEEEKQYQPVAGIAAKLLDGDSLQAEENELLRELLGNVDGEPQQLVDQLVDRHGTGRVLFRNTRAAIKGFPARKLVVHELTPPTEYRDIPCGLLGWHPETELGRGWVNIDPRVNWLKGLLTELESEKVLLICSNPKTVLELKEKLLTQAIHTAVFHEGMDIIERDRAAAYFADPDEGTQLLICSEIGSEGRNFQFAHHLVLFDLPLEPDLLEQRIGRLDRIGQTEDIKIHVPYFKGSPSELLMRWYRDGLDAFSACSPAASGVYRQLGTSLHKVLDQDGDAEELLKQAEETTRQMNAELEVGRDRLLELQSHHPEQAAALAETIENRDYEASPADYLTRYWDAYGVNHEPGPGHSTILHPGNHMLHDHFPSLPYDGATVTFERADALAHEDREFLTWEHPMVQGAMDMLTSGELGSTAFILMQSPSVKAGTLLVEQIHIAECIAPPELEVSRFLPPTAIRLMLDVQGRDLSDRIGHQQLKGDCMSHKRKTANAIIRSQTDLLRNLMKAGNDQAKQRTEQLVQESSKRMQQELRTELTRMKELAQMNPNVREDEIEHLEAMQELLQEYLRQTRVRLDAVRVIVFA